MPQIKDGQGLDVSVPQGQSIAIATVTGTYSATVISGTSAGTVLATASDAGGTFGPYASGATVRLSAGLNSCVSYEVGAAPVVGDAPAAKYSLDPTTGAVVGLVGPDGGLLVSGTHSLAALIGDSLTGQHVMGTVALNGPATNGGWNWGNQFIGSPFVFTQFGWSGDKCASIFSRLHLIPSSASTVFVMAGTNDVLGFSSGSTAGQVTAEKDRILGLFSSAVTKLVAKGKRVVIATIPPNAAYSSGSDARISLLDQVNAGISALAQSGRVWVVDAFTALWDSSAPTTRVFKANHSSDGTHLTNVGGFAWGKAAKAAMKEAYSSISKNVDLYRGFSPAWSLYSQFRSGTGGAAPVYSSPAQDGTLADGWRSLTFSGTVSGCTYSNSSPYSADSVNMVGEWVDAVSGAEDFWQSQTITAGGAAVQRIRMNADFSNTGYLSTPIGVSPGDLWFAEVEVDVSSPSALTEVRLQLEANYTNGTAPADQAFTNTAYVRAIAGWIGSGATAQPLQEGYRAVLRTGVMKVPENVSTNAVTLNIGMDAVFNAAGSAVIKWGRPRFWRQFSPQLF